MAQELTTIKVELNCDGKPMASIQGTVSYYGITPYDKFYEKPEVDDVLAEKDAEIRRMKRALWLARAERADDRARIFYFNDFESLLDIDGFSYDSKKKKDHKKSTARDWRITWLKVERKCRAKAEEYK